MKRWKSILLETDQRAALQMPIRLSAIEDVTSAVSAKHRATDPMRASNEERDAG